MIKINIRHNFPEVIRELGRLPKNIADRALVRTMNATINQSKTDMGRQINKEYRIGAAEAKGRLEVKRASAKQGRLNFEAMLSAKSKARGRSMNLIAFIEQAITLAQAGKRRKAGEGGTQTLRNGGVVRKAVQLRFQVKRTGGKKVIPGAFIANQGRTMFIRKGKARFPIQGLSTIDIPQMFNSKQINEVVRNAMLTRFDKNFQRELRAVLQGWAK